MKKTSNLLIAAAFAVASCNSNSGNNMKDQADTAMSKVENKVEEIKDDYKNNRDADFVKDVIKANNEELSLLALGKQKATRKDIKDAANHMTADHKKMSDDVMAYAAKNNIEIPTDYSHSDSSDMQADKSGKDWDKKWVDKLIGAHSNLIDKFEKEEKDANDAELKAMVTAALPTLRQHYDMLKSIQDKMK